MKAISINLLAPEDRVPSLGLPIDPHQFDPILIGIALGGLLALVALPPLATSAIDNFLVNPAQNQSDQLAHQISQNRGAGKAVERLQAEVTRRENDLEQLQGLVGQGGRWSGTLEELRSLTPTDLWLTSLKTTSNTVDLSGEALDYKDVAYFYTNLQNSTHFASPKLGDITMTTLGTQHVVQFTLDASLVNPGGGS